MHALYSVPVIVPPVLPDDPNYGVPSDHSTAVASPVTQTSTGSAAREYVTLTAPYLTLA